MARELTSCIQSSGLFIHKIVLQQTTALQNAASFMLVQESLVVGRESTEKKIRLFNKNSLFTRNSFQTAAFCCYVKKLM